MFAVAYKIASHFTHPLIVSYRLADGTVHSGMGTFVVLNRDGWFLSAAHLVESFLQHREALADAGRRGLRLQGDWITNHSIWWGADGVSATDIVVEHKADLLLGRLQPFDPDRVAVYPTIKFPADLSLGTSLCKLGYPFHEVRATFDKAAQRFELPAGTLPAPRFPVEGILTRELRTRETYGDGRPVKFLETSTPGLRGQSGGPLLDRHGTVWGVQSRTMHLPLGFRPVVEHDGGRTVENQFLNVGIAVHPEVLVDFLTGRGVAFKMSDY